jgi:hypothetical protein
VGLFFMSEVTLYTLKRRLRYRQSRPRGRGKPQPETLLPKPLIPEEEAHLCKVVVLGLRAITQLKAQGLDMKRDDL